MSVCLYTSPPSRYAVAKWADRVIPPTAAIKESIYGRNLSTTSCFTKALGC